MICINPGVPDSKSNSFALPSADALSTSQKCLMVCSTRCVIITHMCRYIIIMSMCTGFCQFIYFLTCFIFHKYITYITLAHWLVSRIFFRSNGARPRLLRRAEQRRQAFAGLQEPQLGDLFVSHQLAPLKPAVGRKWDVNHRAKGHSYVSHINVEISYGNSLKSVCYIRRYMLRRCEGSMISRQFF